MSEDCPHCVFEKTEANCLGCFEGSHYKPKPVTNADRIRSMSDEELAEFMMSNTDCYYCRARDYDRCASLATTPCGDIWLDWLRQEAET